MVNQAPLLVGIEWFLLSVSVVYYVSSSLSTLMCDAVRSLLGFEDQRILLPLLSAMQSRSIVPDIPPASHRSGGSLSLQWLVYNTTSTLTLSIERFIISVSNRQRFIIITCPFPLSSFPYSYYCFQKVRTRSTQLCIIPHQFGWIQPNVV